MEREGNNSEESLGKVQSLDIKALYDDLESSQKAYKYILNTLIEKSEIKAAILLFLLKNGVIYPNFIKKLFSMNPNAARGYLDRMENAGVVERIPKEDLHKFKEVHELEILLTKHTQISGGKLTRIEYYTLTDVGNKKVGELSNEFESIISKEVHEKIDNILKAIIPAKKWEEELELQRRVDEFKANQEAEAKKKDERKRRARDILLKLCSPFKEEIMKLDVRVVMDEPSEDQHFTLEFLVFVKKLQKEDELISPLGVRQMWQYWKRDSGGEKGGT